MTARALANAYAQTLGTIFTEQQKPYEVEICVAEVGETAEQDQLYRISYDGTIVDEPGFMTMGGQADALSAAMQAALHRGLVAADALAVAVRVLASVGGANGAPRELPATQLEVAVLDRNRGARKFRRLAGAALTALLPAAAPDDAGDDEPAHDEPGASEPPAPQPTPATRRRGTGDP